MLMFRPDSTDWTPIGLLSGNRLVVMSSMATVYALQRAGVPLAGITVDDMVRFLKKFPGPDGNPTCPIPSQYAGLGT